VTRDFARKALASIGLTVLAGLALGYALWPRPTAVDTASLSRGRMQVTIDEDGELRAHDRYAITAPTAGRLLRVPLREGEHVPAGAIVATLVPLPMTPGEHAGQVARVEAAEATYREAQARVAHARADLEQARRDFKRSEILAGAGAMAKQEMEQRRTTVSSATSDLVAAAARETSSAADVRAARANLKALETGQPVDVRAPVDAVVLRVEEPNERVVAAGTPVMLLADPSRYEVRIDVLSTDAVKISPGMTVSVEDWGGTSPMQAKVRVVEPGAFTKVSALGVEEQRVYVIADLIGAPGRLNDGYRVQGRIVIWERPDALRLPIGALFRCAEDWCAFTVEQGRAKRHVVRVGQRNEDTAQVLDGLSERDIVIVYPPTVLVDGARVRSR